MDQQTLDTWQVGEWVRLAHMRIDDSHRIVRINPHGTVDVYGCHGMRVWHVEDLLPGGTNKTLEALRRTGAMRAPDRKAVR
jgi:hypothetical protein